MSEHSRRLSLVNPELTHRSTVSLGKYGSVPINLLLGRPYYLTFEIEDKQSDQDAPSLRVVPVSELNAEVLSSDVPPTETTAEQPDRNESFDIVADDGSVLMKNNRLTVDDASRQTLTMQEIEELKKAGSGSGKEIIEKIMKSHTNLDEKTAFSLAKYTLRKTKKYMRRFTVLPINVSNLTEYMLAEKESTRIMELREEALGLIGSWANAHYSPTPSHLPPQDDTKVGGGRWLVVDETGGLIIASLAERMGILYSQNEQDDESDNDDQDVQDNNPSTEDTGVSAVTSAGQGDVSMQDAVPENGTIESTAPKTEDAEKQPSAKPCRPRTTRHRHDQATHNTIHLLHANAQPNIALLKYFGYDPNNPSHEHPMHNHLKSLSWLQLVDPEADATYEEPEAVPTSVLDTWKSGKRGAYYKKRRRWERCRNIVDETRAGGFDGLVIASAMEPATILKHTVPLLRGGGHVVVYSPTIEPLTGLMDLHSRERKAAYISQISQEEQGEPSEEDFPVDPRLLLAPTLQTSRVRQWQVLPGRTHPMMTSRGGAEGFIFTARKVTPVEGKIEARGKFSKKRKVG